MVIVKSAVLRTGKDEKTFVALELMGDIELVQSQNTGRFYATARRCFISCTFDEQTAQKFIGRKLSGRIFRKETDPYEFVIPETEEEIILSHSWVYEPDQLKLIEEKRESSVSPAEGIYESMVAQIQQGID